MESQLGFKFQPSDQLIIHFLKEKRLDPHFAHHPIKDIGHICSLEPWDLAMESKTETEDQVWYFFYEPYYKYRESNRAHRKTEAGHWTITSRDSQIEARNGLTGTKKFLTFYRRSSCSKAAAKTDWVMHEYHVKDDPSYEREFVFCRIQRKRNKRRKDGISTTDEGESSEQLVSPPQQSPSDHSISNGYHSEQNTHTIPQPQLQNHNSSSFPTVQNTIYQSITNDTPTRLSLPPGHHSVTHNFAGNNRPNDASSSAVQTPISQEQELNYSNSSIDDCDISDCQIFSDEQVNNLIHSLRALLDENSREETGKTLTPTLTHQRLMAKL
ncbi:NAC domain-containing protein 4 [Citrus sinensis]|uniref:NAC domain-containing protein 4 n=1 Tax=Citrus sinensis TaxID=2711 RepID=A0ACB8JIG1_CITSI|nr:NAC domain-containing protein 4 [Citrus sinensis]